MSNQKKSGFDWNGIGHIFQSFRNLRNMSQLEVSKAVDMTRASIANLERGGQKLPIDKLQQVAEVLGVNVELFITEGTVVNGYGLMYKGSPVIIGDSIDEVVREAANQNYGKTQAEQEKNGYKISNIMWGVPEETESVAKAS